MKSTSIVLLLFMPVLAYAGKYQGMNEADVQKMMQQMQQMQGCMENVDREKLKALEVRAHEMEAKVKALCASGNRDQAQDDVIAFAKEISKNPALSEMRKCGEKMQSIMASMPKMPYVDNGKAKDYSRSHVCD